eukprot:CAMPEP_0197525042 /NCGR_PEP_ID=MMETSP1318-20131121/10584_1 /TAXON_ID=552666 /ORGANISM="Partenskyella glossopodia, Strain RCC365" /LENGTH=85 /DNA_ID=CAMNT_0043078197 /DNA_START=788 /DNA_END=1042 /DNA_ORIENTATION=-
MRWFELKGGYDAEIEYPLRFKPCYVLANPDQKIRSAYECPEVGHGKNEGHDSKVLKVLPLGAVIVRDGPRKKQLPHHPDGGAIFG